LAGANRKASGSGSESVSESVLRPGRDVRLFVVSEFLSLGAAQISPAHPSITVFDTDADTDADAQLGRGGGA
jgi:hypothetical protein